MNPKIADFSKTLLIVATALMLSACPNPFIKQHGYLPPDGLEIWEDGTRVNLPDNAPSISQPYRPPPRGLAAVMGQSSRELGYSPHEGIDILEIPGYPVLAAAAGKVIESYYEPAYGNHVLLDHGQDSDGSYVQSQYYHLDSRRVDVGESVVRGQQIGALGSKGLLAGLLPHLHFEILVSTKKDTANYSTLDPHNFWADGRGQITCFDRDKAYPTKPFRIIYPVPCKGIPWR